MKAGRLAFAGFVLDRQAGRLLGPQGEIRLRPQTFRLLEVLVEEAPRVLSQDELLDRAWGVEHLSPASVKQAVSELRQALGDDPARPAVIATVHRRGYRFIAEVSRPENGPEATEATETLETMATAGEGAEAPPPPAPAAGRRRRSLRSLALPVLPALAAPLLLAAWLLPERSTPPTPPSAPVAAVPARPSAAILGFKNLSAEDGDEWISGALAELLAFELTAAGRVRLVPGENVAWTKRELALAGGEHQSRAGLERIGRHLGADLLLTGSYLKEEGERLRLQVLLQDVASGETLAWARESGSRGDLALLAAAAARGLGATLGGPAEGGVRPEAAALASSSESLRFYAEAQERLRVWDAAAALERLEQAASLDPDSPFVHDALAAAAVRLGFEARAAEAARRAVALAEGLPREIRLGMEARSRGILGEWGEAARLYSELHRAFPDDLEHGLQLASAQGAAGRTPKTLATLASLRRLPPPAGTDPRLDLLEADAFWKLGDFTRSLQAAERGIARAEERGSTLLAAAGRSHRAWALARLGRTDDALAEFEACRALYLRMGDRGAAAGAHLGRASLLQSAGRTAEAWKSYEESLSTLREIGDRRREAQALNNFASVLNDEGDLAGVVPLLERSLEIKREVGDLQGAATTLVGLGNLLRVRGDLAGARRRVEEALELSRGLGDAYGTAFALRGLARLLGLEERLGEARAALEEALALSSRIGDRDGAAEARLALGELEHRAGRLDRAREQFQTALDEFRRLDLPADILFSTLRLAGIAQETGRLEEARTAFHDALARARRLRNDFYTAHAHMGLAELAVLERRPDEARKHYGQALDLWKRQGNDTGIETVRTALAGLDGVRPPA